MNRVWAVRGGTVEDALLRARARRLIRRWMDEPHEDRASGWGGCLAAVGALAAGASVEGARRRGMVVERRLAQPEDPKDPPAVVRRRAEVAQIVQLVQIARDMRCLRAAVAAALIARRRGAFWGGV